MIFLIELFGGIALIGWAILYPRTFFSVVWRLLLFVLLLVSIGAFYCLAAQLQYHTQYLVVGSIGLVGSVGGLVRSFFFKKV